MYFADDTWVRVSRHKSIWPSLSFPPGKEPKFHSKATKIGNRAPIVLVIVVALALDLVLFRPFV
jgi:hypothetical protein